ncbi:hypothetical protein F4V57_03745 [Acinetobacter qingfengensis]|uniref:Uncharacterized protein n=1 Tax=Acinetobacter qingfengensis TaxID=1262585 RepID=A0A1E7RC75_9GAMM|nr:hypothetical protein [Acinetobacter qingfengensis]KAA8734882.1 hypothetical protein F4V57_03745 [Acinetobacter qingfengensis]OEY96948.1 hypothetical protein BJI46_11750 [Acinetobacter qingfengensis]
MQKYQIRMRKSLNGSHIHDEAIKYLGTCAVSEIRSFEGEFLNLHDCLEKIATIDGLKDYEIISMILIDQDNHQQLGEDFEWENQELEG